MFILYFILMCVWFVKLIKKKKEGWSLNLYKYKNKL